jgi:hypothetical protein
MAYEQRNNSGLMFRKDRKTAGSKQPEWRGELMIDGALFEISAGEREGRRGKFLAIAVQVAGSWKTQTGS